MPDIDGLIQWYQADARSFLERMAPERIASLDSAFACLAELPPEEIPICFLGNAGVGKSTLLNALVAEHRSLVPQGGVGPLTAQATVVRYARDRRFRATYLSAGHVNKLIFALESVHRRELCLNEEGGPPLDQGNFISEEDRLDVESVVSDETDAEHAEGKRSQIIEEYVRQASFLIRGARNRGAEDLPYLIDSLHVCLGHPRRWNTTANPEDAVRMRDVQRALECADSGVEVRMEDSESEFLSALAKHAAGHLAPLIRTLEVWWDADLLRHGIVLVDLPGVGVANDEYRRVTVEWIRRARAIVLVVDRAGVMEAVADLLRTTGFLNSLLHEQDEQKERATLIVAAVKLDLVADDRRRDERDRSGSQARKWIEHFEEVCAESAEMILGQVRVELEKLVQDGPEATLDVRRAISKEIIDTLAVHPLCAVEFRRLLRQDDEDRPRIRVAEESRVPQFASVLAAFGRAREARLRTKTQERFNEAHERVKTTLGLVVEQWSQDARAAEEGARLRSELEEIAEPLLRDLAIRQGAYREFLRESMPREIRARADVAAREAERDIGKYLRRYEEYHWATLRAAIRRGGKFIGSKQVDIPNDVTLRFEEPVAVVWSKTLLPEIRQKTRNLVEDYIRLVGAVLDWSIGQGSRARPQIVETIHCDLQAQAREIAEIGDDAIDELKQRVKQEICREVEVEVRRKCDAFVRARLHEGAGTKRRILDFLQELAPAIVQAATPAAFAVLDSNYRQVSEQISQALADTRNPVDAAVQALVSTHEETVRRSDAGRRAEVIQEAHRLLQCMPRPAATGANG